MVRLAIKWIRQDRTLGLKLLSKRRDAEIIAINSLR